MRKVRIRRFELGTPSLEKIFLPFAAFPRGTAWLLAAGAEPPASVRVSAASI